MFAMNTLQIQDMACQTSRCFSDSQLDLCDLDTCPTSSASFSIEIRRNGKHNIFADSQSDQVLDLYIRHSKQLGKKRHGTYPTMDSESGESSDCDDCAAKRDNLPSLCEPASPPPAFSMKDLWSDVKDDVIDVTSSPRLVARRNAVWCLNSDFVENGEMKKESAKSCCQAGLSRTKKVYHDLSALA